MVCPLNTGKGTGSSSCSNLDLIEEDLMLFVKHTHMLGHSNSVLGRWQQFCWYHTPMKNPVIDKVKNRLTSHYIMRKVNIAGTIHPFSPSILCYTNNVYLQNDL